MHAIPDPKLLSQGKVRVNGQNLPVFKIEVLTINESIKQNLDFSWEVIEMNEREIHSQLVFNKAIYVSS